MVHLSIALINNNLPASSALLRQSVPLTVMVVEVTTMTVNHYPIELLGLLSPSALLRFSVLLIITVVVIVVITPIGVLRGCLPASSALLRFSVLLITAIVVVSFENLIW